MFGLLQSFVKSIQLQTPQLMQSLNLIVQDSLIDKLSFIYFMYIWEKGLLDFTKNIFFNKFGQE
jgi:hypothetical protein